MVLIIRHQLFDWKILRSSKGKIKSIVIGNLNIGGTGKTPFTLMLAQEIKKFHPIAFLSRGYGRKTKGFLMIEDHFNSDQVGDEPLLIKKQLGDTPCFVGEKRVPAIEQIYQLYPETHWVILDDAYQHRALKADISIVLTRWDCPFSSDYLWPVGNLRDLSSAIQGASAVVITSTPENASVKEIELKKSEIARHYNGPIFTAQICVKELKSLNGDLNKVCTPPIGAFSGIAHPDAFLETLLSRYPITQSISFPDHHSFSEQDVQKLTTEMVNFGGKINSWITTEKDAMRLMEKDEWKALPIFYLTIESRIHPADQEKWNQWLNHQIQK
jgi:tetraacyldisaccharide 4'-kinase